MDLSSAILIVGRLFSTFKNMFVETSPFNASCLGAERVGQNTIKCTHVWTLWNRGWCFTKVIILMLPPPPQTFTALFTSHLLNSVHCLFTFQFTYIFYFGFGSFSLHKAIRTRSKPLYFKLRLILYFVLTNHNSLNWMCQLKN